jgi:hypothetical protein
MSSEKLQQAYRAIDAYNAKDPHTESVDGKQIPKEVLYGQRMTKKMDAYLPDAPEHLKLAARAQHIGRWEIPRDTYPMDRKGYLQWRSAEKFHHTKIIEPILTEIGYDSGTIEKVKFLLLKKELATNPETQVLEDVVCLVFIEHYLEEFAAQHDDDKVADILRKTMKKMSPRCLAETSNLKVSERIQGLLLKAVGGN